MTTFLLIVIAVLLFVLASKLAPQEVGEIWKLAIVTGIFYLIFEYWTVILAIPVIIFYALKEFVSSDTFAWIWYTVGGFVLAWVAYAAVQRLITDYRSTEGRHKLIAYTRKVLTIAWKVLLYATLGSTVLIVFFLALAYFNGVLQ